MWCWYMYLQKDPYPACGSDQEVPEQVSGFETTVGFFFRFSFESPGQNQNKAEAILIWFSCQ